MGVTRTVELLPVAKERDVQDDPIPLPVATAQLKEDIAANQAPIVPKDTVPAVNFDVEAGKEDVPVGATVSSSIFNLCNTILGAGILSTALLFKWNGFVLQMVILAGAGTFMSFTAECLLAAGLATNKHSYKEVVTHVLGKVAAKLLLLCQVISMVGVTIAYIILIGDFGRNILHDFGVSMDRRIIMLVLDLTMCYPLSLIKSVNALRFTSLIAIGCISLYAASSLFDSSYQAVVYGPANVKPFSFSDTFFRTIPIALVSYQCHVMVFPIFSELKTSSPGAPKTGPMKTVLRVSFGFCTFCYIIAGLSGYLRWGDRIDSGNILNTYSDYSMEVGLPWLFTLVQAGYLFVIIFSYPLICFASRIGIEDLFFSGTKSSQLRITAIASAIFAIDIIVAFLVSDISMVFSFIGSLASPTTSIILPSLCFFFVAKSNNAISLHSILSLLAAIVGVLIMISGLYYSLTDL